MYALVIIAFLVGRHFLPCSPLATCHYLHLDALFQVAEGRVSAANDLASACTKLIRFIQATTTRAPPWTRLKPFHRLHKRCLRGKPPSYIGRNHAILGSLRHYVLYFSTIREDSNDAARAG